MQVIPLQPIPSQTFTVTLNNQLCQINVYQKRYGLFLDLFVGGVLILGGVICENLNRIVRNSYLGFSGDLTFFDNQGTSDPIYTGLGTRYSLLYLAPSDLLTNVNSLD
jgi:hypothetical protein